MTRSLTRASLAVFLTLAAGAATVLGPGEALPLDRLREMPERLEVPVPAQPPPLAKTAAFEHGTFFPGHTSAANGR